MTPLQIEMMLHFHCSPLPYPNRSPAAEEALQWFRSEGLIESTGMGSVRLSERGDAYVKFLIALPLPIANWQIPGPWNPSGPRVKFKAQEEER